MSKTVITCGPIERMVLVALAGIYFSDSDYCYLNFKAIALRGKVPQHQVRRAVRALARKRLAEFGRGLWTDEGELAGSGYCCTRSGAEWLRRNPEHAA